MDPQEQTRALREQISAVIDRFRAEFDITYATAVGVLNLIAFDLACEGRGLDKDE